ncbi:lymphokine-activated killer T-cell-originated protein kinase homolog isoform X2 [Hypomesus transpacificus]|uniref:lymphokine-activated killer T-cell-originated protein kinase homolog isoform X2 n=1 Tax=Hypomesus transpacificus TaxID=137520 RepID=UPI001F07F0B0|nr:lymphokine-activated killer T-cell-originated protein kinase homolog isoform X2 [Hypomesus transpacificus]
MDPVKVTSSPFDADSFKTPRKPDRVRNLTQKGIVGTPCTPITIPASPFMKKLGCGTGVNVYLFDRVGKLNLSPWAVKKINNRCASRQIDVYQSRLFDEAKILKDLKHPNIVGFRAFTTATDGSKCLAMEYGGEQSLNDLIERRKEEGLQAFPVCDIEKVALHVARGLQYLHNEKRLLHGDIKSCNVVVKGDFDTVKICDVGVSLQLDENMKVADPKATYVGTEPWKPMEALEEEGEITDKADIFAYGLTLWEMMTLDMPHLDMLGNDEYVIVKPYCSPCIICRILSKSFVCCIKCLIFLFCLNAIVHPQNLKYLFSFLPVVPFIYLYCLEIFALEMSGLHI